MDQVLCQRLELVVVARHLSDAVAGGVARAHATASRRKKLRPVEASHGVALLTGAISRSVPAGTRFRDVTPSAEINKLSGAVGFGLTGELLVPVGFQMLERLAEGDRSRQAVHGVGEPVRVHEVDCAPSVKYAACGMLQVCTTALSVSGRPVRSVVPPGTS